MSDAIISGTRQSAALCSSDPGRYATAAWNNSA